MVWEIKEMKQHVTIVGILHIALGAFGILAGIGVALILFLVVPVAEDVEGQVVLTILGIGIPLLLLLLNGPRIIGGIWLLKHRSWARYVVMIFSALSLLNIPIGTAVGIYSLWVLAQEETAQLFGRGSAQEETI